jgi:hypothetical protein
MSSWRSEILKEFSLDAQAITAIADPDRLFSEPILSQALDDQGFELLLYEDSVSFRFAFESKVRTRLDAGDKINLVVVLHGEQDCLLELPFDVLTRARRTSFSLTTIFPTLSYPVLRGLEPQYIDPLYVAQNRFRPGILGENATRDFILRHVFEIAAELINSDADVLRMLIRRHNSVRSIPPALVDRLVQVLQQDGRFADWPLKTLLSDRSLFYSFLQERWPIFLNGVGEGKPSSNSTLLIPGPADIPFDDSDIRVYISNLFVEGLLQPVDWHGEPEPWAAAGVSHNPQYTRDRHLAALLEIVEREMPGDDANHSEWLRFSRVWSEVNLLNSTPGNEFVSASHSQFLRLQTLIDGRFCEWFQRRIGTLSSLPSNPPVMVHHVARFLAAELKDSVKIALLVLDGLSLEQWLIVKRELSRQRPSWRFDESAVFAWAPTITSVSRQSIFAGKAPLYFPSSIYSTGREANLWQQFWSDQGLAAHEIAYLKGLGDQHSLGAVETVLAECKIRIVGAVVDKVDRIMHGMELGAAGMHNQVHQWAAEGFLAVLLDKFMVAGFNVFVTSDHGNVEAVGHGKPSEGVIADVRGERARIYSDPLLRQTVAARFPSALTWKPIGLPGDFLPLLSAGRSAFVSEGTRTIAHGGVTLEEAIVPFIRISGDKP